MEDLDKWIFKDQNTLDELQTQIETICCSTLQEIVSRRAANCEVHSQQPGQTAVAPDVSLNFCTITFYETNCVLQYRRFYAYCIFFTEHPSGRKR